jgi:hypothetical protein
MMDLRKAVLHNKAGISRWNSLTGIRPLLRSTGCGQAREAIELGGRLSLGGGRAWEAVKFGRRPSSGRRVHVRVSTLRSFIAAVDWLVEKNPGGSCENTHQATCHNARKVCHIMRMKVVSRPSSDRTPHLKSRRRVECVRKQPLSSCRRNAQEWEGRRTRLSIKSMEDEAV